jgi:hypothetical protein
LTPERQAIGSPVSGRTRAFVAATILSGRRAFGASVLPLNYFFLECEVYPSQQLNEEEWWRGLRSPSAGRWAGNRDKS